MIRKNALNCKLFRIKTSSKELFDSFMAGFRPERETCPVCGSTGNCHPHAYYSRYIVDFRNGSACTERLRVLRLRCESCGHTHAVLPDFIIPYATYGITFILRVLLAYVNRFRSICLPTVEAICHFFRISPRMLYRWVAIFRSHKQQWLGVLADLETSGLDFLHGILSRPICSEFLAGFFRSMTVSFLQRHRNPIQGNPKGARSAGQCGSPPDP